MSTGPLSEAIRARRVLVCVGSGGVGKTTVAAALGLSAALAGKSSLVCTIDPAKRLANALGLTTLGNAESPVPEDHWARAGLPPGAPFRAMMLDMRQTWDELIRRHAPPDTQQRILSNRYYRALSTALAGSQEYIALEKLWELRTQRDYGLVVLDTPPTAHALDFLDAPNRILDFLDNDATRWLLTPALLAGRVGLTLFNVGSSFIAKTLARFTGVQMLKELADFMLALRGMNDQFRGRAKNVRDLLASNDTAFVVVTTPNRERMGEAVSFWRLLRDNGMAVAAVVVNRVHPPVGERELTEAARLEPSLRAKMRETLEEARALADADAAGIAELRALCHPTPLVPVPRAETDVHDLAGLSATGRFLLSGA